MGAEPQRYPIKQGSRKFLICGKRRKCGKPNSRASFFLQATSDEVVGVSRLTLLDCLTTRVYLDNTRTHMRVLFYMVICASFYLDFRLFKVRSLRSRGGEIPEFASRDLACLDYPNISAPIGRNICLADAFLCLLLPNDIRVLFPKKSTFIKISLPLHLPNSPRVKDQGRTKDEPRNTQRTPKERPTTQKCFLLRLAISKKSLLR